MVAINTPILGQKYSTKKLLIMITQSALFFAWGCLLGTSCMHMHSREQSEGDIDCLGCAEEVRACTLRGPRVGVTLSGFSVNRVIGLMRWKSHQ